MHVHRQTDAFAKKYKQTHTLTHPHPRAAKPMSVRPDFHSLLFSALLIFVTTSWRSFHPKYSRTFLRLGRLYVRESACVRARARECLWNHMCAAFIASCYIFTRVVCNSFLRVHIYIRSARHAPPPTHTHKHKSTHTHAHTHTHTHICVSLCSPCLHLCEPNSSRMTKSLMGQRAWVYVFDTDALTPCLCAGQSM
jgi:hypothetical protein